MGKCQLSAFESTGYWSLSRDHAGMGVSMNNGPTLTPERQPTSVLEPLLFGAKAAAALCGRRLRTWRSWDSAGRIPRPIRIGRSTLWRVAELHAWVAAGCPRRQEWEARKVAEQRRK
jgi:predicted DNA-binding transcriptional regulator AlpA